MKQLFSTILLLISVLILKSQATFTDTFLQTNSKFRLLYVDLQTSHAYVYKMGSHLDKAGTGYSIINIDTLVRQTENTFEGRTTKLITEEDKYYLLTEAKKQKKLEVSPVKNSKLVTTNLNNGYFLDHYFEMSAELNKKYPLSHYSFRAGYYAWEQLKNKEVDHELFKVFTNKQLQEIKDSVGHIQERYIALTDYLLKNIETLDYTTLKDSLTKLPAVYRSVSSYYITVIDKVAVQKPEYIFSLAEDFPADKNLIFYTIHDNDQAIPGLKAVQGHDALKKEFFKDRKFTKTFPYRIVGTYAIVAGVIVILASL